MQGTTKQLNRGPPVGSSSVDTPRLPYLLRTHRRSKDGVIVPPALLFSSSGTESRTTTNNKPHRSTKPHTTSAVPLFSGVTVDTLVTSCRYLMHVLYTRIPAVPILLRVRISAKQISRAAPNDFRFPGLNAADLA